MLPQLLTYLLTYIKIQEKIIVYLMGIIFEKSMARALEKRTPVIIPELHELPQMPARWTKLIQMSQDYVLGRQTA